MNETDVRAEVIEPLLQRLGYRIVGNALIRREHPVKYPATYLGRKKPGKDLALRGIADFTLEVANHARWTLEAKPPSDALDEEAIQQAWSYAIHPEIQSSYFAICNGREFRAYSTSAAWNAEPILSITNSEILTRFSEIESVLGPTAIARRHPNQLLRAGKPIAPGFGSFERIASGSISYNSNSINAPLLNQMNVSVIDGTIRRDSTGRLQAILHAVGPFREFQERIEQLGLSVQIYETEDEYVSLTLDRPTSFLFQADRPLPAGLDITTFKPFELENPPRVVIHAVATGHLNGDTFSGEFSNEATYYSADKSARVVGKGKFSLRFG